MFGHNLGYSLLFLYNVSILWSFFPWTNYERGFPFARRGVWRQFSHVWLDLANLGWNLKSIWETCSNLASLYCLQDAIWGSPWSDTLETPDERNCEYLITSCLLFCGSCKRPPQIRGLSLPCPSPFEIGLGCALPRWVQKGCSRPLLTPRLSQ